MVTSGPGSARKRRDGRDQRIELDRLEEVAREAAGGAPQRAVAATSLLAPGRPARSLNPAACAVQRSRQVLRTEYRDTLDRKGFSHEEPGPA